MSDISRLPPALQNVVAARLGAPAASAAKEAQPASGPAPKGYKESFDVELRAAAFSEEDTPATKAALGRLDQQLSSGQPLRTDVPRGYYLNIRV